MKYLKYFESNVSDISEDEIKDIFNDLCLEDDFDIDVKFCKKLNQYGLIGKITPDQIELGFVPYIDVKLTSKTIPYDIAKFEPLGQYVREGATFFKHMEQIQLRLKYLGLKYEKITVERNVINILIYST